MTPSTDSARGLELLLVDDDPVVVQALAAIVRDVGRCRFALNGEQALRLMHERTPDMVLLDAQLGQGMTGFDVLDRMHESEALRKVPTLLITNMVDEAAHQQGLQKGAVDFLAKPVSPAILLARINTHWRLHTLRRELERLSALDQVKLAAALDELEKKNEALTASTAELESANHNLMQFVRIASHDLREPLNTVTQFTDLLVADHRNGLPDAGQAYLQRIQKASARMRVLLDDVVNYSRIQYADGLSMEPVDLETVADHLVDALGGRILQTGCRLERGPMPRVMGQHDLLALLLQNLVSNAIKFAQPGEPPAVDLSADIDGTHATIHVRDRGIGMDAEQVQRIFKPFGRLHPRSVYEGTGLGLVIAQEIAALHDAEIEVRSESGVGSDFFFSLPLAPST